MEFDRQTTIEYLAYAATVAGVIVIQHMAFRTPQWKGRELVRRFLGDTTVLALFALFLVLDGAADWVTWLGIVGGFAIAGAVKAAAAWFDARQRASILREFDETTGADQ